MHGSKPTKVMDGVSTTFTSICQMKDAGHKANILNDEFKDIGVGAVKDFGTKSCPPDRRAGRPGPAAYAGIGTRAGLVVGEALSAWPA